MARRHVVPPTSRGVPPDAPNAGVAAEPSDPPSGGGESPPRTTADAPPLADLLALLQASPNQGAPEGASDDGVADLAASLIGERLVVPTFLIDQALGLNNRQLWAAVLDELRGSVSPGTFATWLKPTRLIGLLDADDALVVGVPNSFARDWLGERFAAPAEAAVEVVLGRHRCVRFEVESDWLAASAGRLVFR